MNSIAAKRCGILKRRAARLIFLAAVSLALISSGNLPAIAQSQAPTANSKRDADEKTDCVRNLKLIYAAVQAYKADHKDIPNWLSDLVPQYLSDTSILICPVCKRTGETETSALADPKVPTSYAYQFSPAHVGKNPDWTWRDWKRRQMGLVGSSVPLLCCKHHGATLNVAFDGRVYESEGPWELTLTNQVNVSDLTPEKIFASALARGMDGAGGGLDLAPVAVPARDARATASQIDLTSFYNVRLDDSWISGTNNNLAELPVGTQVLADVAFDVRGVIQLAGAKESMKRFPTIVKGIRIGQKCARLHFLGACAFGNIGNNDGREIAYYVAHTADHKELNIPIIHGRDWGDWYTKKADAPDETVMVVAWSGSNPPAALLKRKVRLFSATWVNPSPEVQIDTLDFISHGDGPAPFLIAITAD